MRPEQQPLAQDVFAAVYDAQRGTLRPAGIRVRAGRTSCPADRSTVGAVVSSTAPDDPAAVDWAALRGRRVVLDDRWMSDDERPGREMRHQGAVSDVASAGAIELTLTRYDGSTRLLRPVGQFTVTDGDTGEVLYTPALRAPRKVPMAFIEAVREVAPERWEDLEWVMRTMPVDQLPQQKVEELIDMAAHVEWECTRERDVLDDPASPAAAYAQAARDVVGLWEPDAGPAAKP